MPSVGDTGAPPPPRTETPVFGPPTAVGPTVLWVILGGLLVAAILWVLAQRRRALVDVTLSDEGVDTDGNTGGSVGLGIGPLTVAERALQLAEGGRLAEASHLLLLDALAGVTGRPIEQLADASTSREILAGEGVTGAQRKPLGVLVRAVEVSLFAGRPLERREFDEALASYRRLAESP